MYNEQLFMINKVFRDELKTYLAVKWHHNNLKKDFSLINTLIMIINEYLNPDQ